jgi:hypothetical protein
MLQSPHFLYHTDVLRSPNVTGPNQLDAFGLASRLSYFLWQSAPDEELLNAAASGELLVDEGLQSQALRMLADERARRAVSSFHLQWLELQQLPAFSKDDERWSSALAWDMLDEVTSLANDVILQRGGTLRDLLTTTESVASPELFGLYGGEPLDAPTRVELVPEQRSGLLTRAAFAARFATVNASSISQRGLWVRKHLLCTDVPPDPLVSLPEEPEGRTSRERSEVVLAEPACAPCHELIDPIGFSFENYDAIGGFRTEEDGYPIDPSGVVSDPNDGRISVANAHELSAVLADLRTARDCTALNWWRFALGRSGTSEDGEAIAELQYLFDRADGNLLALIQCIVMGPSFRSGGVGGSNVR